MSHRWTLPGSLLSCCLALTGCGAPPDGAGNGPTDPAQRHQAARTLLDLGLPAGARAALQSIPATARTADMTLDLARALIESGDPGLAARTALDAAERFPTSTREALVVALTSQEADWDAPGCAETLERLRAYRLTSGERERVDAATRRLEAFSGRVAAQTQDYAHPEQWPFEISDPYLVEVDAVRKRVTLRKGPATDPAVQVDLTGDGRALVLSLRLSIERLDPGAAFVVSMQPLAHEGAPAAGAFTLRIGSPRGTLDPAVAQFEIAGPMRAGAGSALAPCPPGEVRLRARWSRGAAGWQIEGELREEGTGHRRVWREAVEPAGAFATGARVTVAGAVDGEEGSLFRVALGELEARLVDGAWRPVKRSAVIDAPLAEGTRLLVARQWTEAMARFGRIRHGTPDSARATFFAAFAAVRAGQAARAEGLLREILRTDSALARRAYYYLRWDRGLAGLLAGALGGNELAAWLLRSAAESAAAGDLEGALADLDAALLHAPESAPAREARANLLADAGRLEAALRDTGEALAGRNPSPGLRALQADLLRRLDRAGEAVTAWERLAVEAGERAEDVFQRCLARVQAGDLARARDDAQRTIALEPRLAWPYLALALCHLKNQDPASAEIEARRAQSIDPWDGRAHALLGLILTQRGNESAARVALATAVGLSPHEPLVEEWCAAARRAQAAPPKR